MHFVVKLFHRIYKEEIFIWRREWHFIKKVNVRIFEHWPREIEISKTYMFSWYWYKSKLLFFSNNIVINKIEDRSRKQYVKFHYYYLTVFDFRTIIWCNIRDVQCLYSLKSNDTGATAGIFRLELKVIQVISNNSRKFYNVRSDLSPEELCNIISNHCSSYHLKKNRWFYI